MKEEHKKLTELAAFAGQIMLESHAESYRVEDTVRRILQTSGLSVTEVISNTTGLFITLDDDDPTVESITLVRRITHRGNHLNKIYRVNNISRQLTSGTITVDEAMEKLSIVNESEYKMLDIDLATLLMVVAFTIMLGGNVWEVLISLIAGVFVALNRIWQSSFGMNEFFAGTMTTMFSALIITTLLHYLPYQLNSDIIIISGLMPIYPGTAFTNGIRDTLKGDYNSGLARITDAFVIALSLAIGVAIGLYFSGGIIRWI